MGREGLKNSSKKENKLMSSMKTNSEKRTVNPLSANPTKGSNAPKQFVGNLPTNCLSVLYHFVGLALKGLI